SWHRRTCARGALWSVSTRQPGASPMPRRPSGISVRGAIRGRSSRRSRARPEGSRLDRARYSKYSYRVTRIAVPFAGGEVHTPPARVRSLRIALSLTVLAGIAAAYAYVPSSGVLALIAVMVAALFVSLRIRTSGRGFDPLEIIVPVGVAYLGYFGLGTIYDL